jgi:hypothetical protein
VPTLKHKKKIILLCILSIGVLGLSTTTNNVLILENLPSSKTIFISRVYTGDEFTMRWMHSVELEPWEEVFRIDEKSEVILDRTRFKAFGAGVPSKAGNKAVIKDGYVVYSGINKKIPEITYGISNFAKHTFYFKNNEYKLYEMVENDSPIKISTTQIHILPYLIKKLATLR